MNEWLSKNQISSILNRATEMLFVQNPKGTSMGVLFGIIVPTLVDIVGSVLKVNPPINFTRVNYIFSICLGIFIFNIPSLLRRPHLDQDIEAFLASIAKAKKEGNISPVQAKLLYVSLYEKVLAQVTLDKPTQEKIREIEKRPTSSE